MKRQEGKHIAGTTKRFLSVAKTSAFAKAVSVFLAVYNVLVTAVTLPGPSKVGLAVTTACRLQLCVASKLAGHCSTYLLKSPVEGEVLKCHCIVLGMSVV